MKQRCYIGFHPGAKNNFRLLTYREARKQYLAAIKNHMGFRYILLISLVTLRDGYSSSLIREAMDYFSLWVSATEYPIERVGESILEGLMEGYGMFVAPLAREPARKPDIVLSTADSDLTKSSLLLLVSVINRDDRRALHPLLYFRKVPRHLIIRRIGIEVTRMGLSCQELFIIAQDSVTAYQVDKAFGFDIIHDRLRHLCLFIQLLFEASDDATDENSRLELTIEAREVWYRIVEDNYHGPLII